MDAKFRSDQEKLPKLYKEPSNNFSNCLVPLTDYNDDKTSRDLSNKFSECIPDDLILSLKQAEHVKEFLGPPNKRTMKSLAKNPSLIKRCDNAWNFERQRERFKFLTEQPICSCGAGKDISFIYDSVANSKPTKKFPVSKYDPSAVRASQRALEINEKVSESLVPEEFRVVKNVGVWPIKVEESQYTTHTEDHASHITMFPSLKPTGRHEVVQLKHTMDSLLKRVGADIVDQKGPTQLHNLLEIVKQEQDIYNIIFYEVIRQVTVECKDRGEILSKLRERYANLLSRVPKEIKSLHEEIIAQRTLDRRLTEELLQFKTTIGYLTDELSSVKQHDKFISEQAEIYQKDLNKAVNEAQKNAQLLNEYHEIYELQRNRLEKSIETLTDERELWIQTAYSIALKITEENKLVTAKRLNLAEKSWSKLARHFTLLISDRDTKDLCKIQNYTENWKENLNDIRYLIGENEKVSKKNIEILKNYLKKLNETVAPLIDQNGVKPIGFKVLHIMVMYLRNLYQIANKECDKFNAETVIENEARIQVCEGIGRKLVAACDTLLNRHEHSKDPEKIKKYMIYRDLKIDMTKLQEQYLNRSCGENGYSKTVLLLTNQLDFWTQKLNTIYQHEESKDEKNRMETRIVEIDLQVFMQSLLEWELLLGKASSYIGSMRREFSDIQKHSTDDKSPEIVEEPLIVHEELFNEIHAWLSALCHHIDTENACLIEKVSVTHTKMVHWMVQALLRLAPDQEALSDEAKKTIYESTTTKDDLVFKANNLITIVNEFTGDITLLAKRLVDEQAQNIEPKALENFEIETKNLETLKIDCQEWIFSIKLLIDELNGNRLHRMQGNRRVVKKNRVEFTDDQNSVSSSNTNKLESDANMSQEFDNRSMTERTMDNNELVDNSQEIIVPIQNMDSFEILTEDTNTQRRYLDNIDFNDSNHLSEAELKSTAYNALKTIDKLQHELIGTEERAQNSENRVTELEFELEEALKNIRRLEKTVNDLKIKDSTTAEISPSTDETKQTEKTEQTEHVEQNEQTQKELI